MRRTTSDTTAGEVRLEVRRLRETVHELADAVDALAAEHDQQTGGQGPPEHAQAARELAREAREVCGPVVPERERLRPPWERQGYDSKQAWLTDQNEPETER